MKGDYNTVRPAHRAETDYTAYKFCIKKDLFGSTILGKIWKAALYTPVDDQTEFGGFVEANPRIRPVFVGAQRAAPNHQNHVGRLLLRYWK